MTCVILELHKKPVFDCQVSVSRQLINFNFFRNYFTSQSADHTHNVLISSIIFNWLMEIIHSITPLFAALSSHFFISFFEITQNHKLPVYGWAWMRRIFEFFFYFRNFMFAVNRSWIYAREISIWMPLISQLLSTSRHSTHMWNLIFFNIYILCRVSEAKSEILIHKINKCMCPYLE